MRKTLRGIEMRIIFGMILVLMAASAIAGQRAITDTGDEVLLNENGTWQYINNPEKNKLLQIPTNDKLFEKPSNATFLLKSTKNNSAIWIDAKKWSFTKSAAGENSEYEFELKGTDLYGMALNESIPMPLEALANIAFDNALAAAPDAKIISKEYRVVNGQKIIYMQMDGTMEGVPFTYRGYYFSNDKGATQFITYTATSLVEKYAMDIEEFLNGLTSQ